MWPAFAGSAVSRQGLADGDVDHLDNPSDAEIMEAWMELGKAGVCQVASLSCLE
jgi:hypothetical protein